MLGISISLFGIAWILSSTGGAGAIGLGLSFVGVLVCLFALTFWKDN
jgi:hypothetical protein